VRWPPNQTAHAEDFQGVARFGDGRVHCRRFRKVVSHSVKHSSNPEVAALAGKILASIHTPPPPGGKFTAIQEFRFR